MTNATLLSQRIQNIQPSPTMAISAKAKAMKAEGLNVISFSAGEPDFDTPQNIKDAAKKAIDNGDTKYTPVAGTPALKKAIQNKLKRDQNVDYALDEILVSCGGKHSLYNIFQVMIDSGEEVIIPAPYWVSYPDQVILAEGKPVIVKTSQDNDFCLTPDQLKKAITSKTKALILNSPSNPTGATYTKEQILELAQICVEKNIYIISDEIYEKVIYENFEVVSPVSLSQKIKDITLIVNGVSKAYSMTGWRMGYTAGPKEIIAAMSKLQGQCTSGICSITQAACVEALDGSQEAVSQMVVAFSERRNFIVEKLNTLPGISCTKPQGAFYVFPSIEKVIGKKTPDGHTLNSCTDVCNFLLEKYFVALVPGEGFGMPGFMRMSYATSLENIKNGLERIEKALLSLS